MKCKGGGIRGAKALFKGPLIQISCSIESASIYSNRTVKYSNRTVKFKITKKHAIHINKSIFDYDMMHINFLNFS